MDSERRVATGSKITTFLKSLQNGKGIPCNLPICKDCGISCVRHPNFQTREITLYPKTVVLSTRYDCLVEKAGPDEKIEALDRELELFNEDLAKTIPPTEFPPLWEFNSLRPKQSE